MRVLMIQCCFGLFLARSIVTLSFSKQLPFQETIQGVSEAGDTIFDMLKKDDRFSDVSRLIAADNRLLNHLNDSKRQTTFFAPTNAAIFNFLNKAEGVIEERNISELQKRLGYHMFSGNLLAQTFLGTRVVKTFRKEEQLYGNSQRLKISSNHETLKLNEKVLAKEVDLRASNGVIHVISELLTDPLTITDTLIEHPDKFSALNLALQRTGLHQLLSETCGVTLLAPTNLAFRNLGCKNLNYLFSSQGLKDLEKILRHHISSKLAYSSSFKHFQSYEVSCKYDKIESSSKRKHKHKHKHNHHTFRKSKSLSTLFGGKVQFVVKQPHSNITSLWVNHESRVLYTDLISQNGVVHVIDRILIPQGVNITNDGWWDDDQYCATTMSEKSFVQY